MNFLEKKYVYFDEDGAAQGDKPLLETMITTQFTGLRTYAPDLIVWNESLFLFTLANNSYQGPVSIWIW